MLCVLFLYGLITVLYPNCIGIRSFCKMGTHGLSSYIVQIHMALEKGSVYNEGNTVHSCVLQDGILTNSQ